MRAIATNRIMANWKPQPIEKSREMKLAAQKAIEQARAKQETRVFMQEQKRLHAKSLEAVVATIETPPEPVNRHQSTTQPERFAQIFTAVCKELAVNHTDVRSRLRHPRLVAARMLIVYLSRAHTMLSYPDIQLLMGSSTKSHTTAITQQQRIEGLMLNKPNEPMFFGDSRTFRQMVDSFDGARLCFKDATP